MSYSQPVYIASAIRTPVGKAPRGVFNTTRPDDLLSHAISHVLKQTPSIDLSAIDDVIIGCAMPEGEQGMNVARIGSLLAGVPDTVPAMTINRFCSSGLQSIAMAADRIAAGQAQMILAGGVESMSSVPLGGYHFRANPEYFSKNENTGIAYGMGITAEIVAKQFKITREMGEAFAVESHKRAVNAVKEGEFKNEIAPFTVTSRIPNLSNGTIESNSMTVENDEGPRADTSLESMARLRTAFQADGTVTAATASQMSDGAGALLIVSEQALKDFNLTPLARFVSFNVAGVPPEVMGIGPVAAIPKALAGTGLTLKDMDWIELNEAFAAQSLAVMQELNMDHSKVNPLGGAIALGHPLGATGAIRAATLVHGLRRHQQKYGMVTMCIGTGMGAAGIFESL